MANPLIQKPVALTLATGLLAIFAFVSFSLRAEPRLNINQSLDSAFYAYTHGDYEKAAQLFRQVLELNPEEKAALKGVNACEKKIQEKRVDQKNGFIQTLKLARKMIRSEKYLEASDRIGTILSQEPEHPGALKLNQELKQTLEKKLSQCKKSSFLFLVYEGFLHYAAQRYDESIRSWNSALMLDSTGKNVADYVVRAEQAGRETYENELLVNGKQQAQTALETGNYSEAHRILKKLLLIFPEDDQARELLAQTEDRLETKKKESLIGSHYDRGLSLYLEKNYNESQKEWNHILEVDPDNQVAKNYLEKIENQNRANVRTASPNQSRVLSLLLEERYPEALDLLQSLSAKSPSLELKSLMERARKEQLQKADQYHREGLISLSQGKTREAIEKWKSAVRIYPGHSQSQDALSKISAKNKN